MPLSRRPDAAIRGRSSQQPQDLDLFMRQRNSRRRTKALCRAFLGLIMRYLAYFEECNLLRPTRACSDKAIFWGSRREAPYQRSPSHLETKEIPRESASDTQNEESAGLPSSSIAVREWEAVPATTLSRLSSDQGYTDDKHVAISQYSAAVVIPRPDCRHQTMFAESPIRTVAKPCDDAQILLDAAIQHRDSQYCRTEARPGTLEI
jgi:hypothetical protein